MRYDGGVGRRDVTRVHLWLIALATRRIDRGRRGDASCSSDPRDTLRTVGVQTRPPPHPPPDAAQEARDRELLAQTASGDLDSWGSLCLRLGPGIAGWLCQELPEHPGDIEDLVAKVYDRIWDRAGSFRGDSKVQTWAIGIARNIKREHLRKAAREKATDLQEHEDTPTPPAPVEKAGDRAHIALLMEAIASLPQAQRTAVLRETGAGPGPRADLHGKEAARHRQSLHRGRRRLQDILTTEKRYEALRARWMR